MTVTIEQVVGQARTLLSGPLQGEYGILADDYTPGDSTISLSSDRRITDGSAVCIGLTTLRTVGNETRAPRVIPGTDGSPDLPAPSGSFVVLMPRFTTFQVFTEVQSTVMEVASPKHGLYRVLEEQFPVDVVDGTYVLAQPALKVLRVRYRRPGSTDDWSDVAWRFQAGAPDGPTVRTATWVPGGTHVHVQYAATFSQPQALDDTLGSLNIPDEYQRLLAVGAARNLALSSEGRRAQPFSQGDSRRAEEVPITASVVVYDRLRAQFRDLVADARASLISQHPYRFKMEQFG